MTDSTDGNHRRIEVGEWLFEFLTFGAWVNHASRLFRFHEVTGRDTVCIDQKGRLCTIGKHFMCARDEGTFPIAVFRMRSDSSANSRPTSISENPTVG